MAEYQWFGPDSSRDSNVIMASENNPNFGGRAKAKYFAKHASQKVVGLIPYGFFIQEGIKKRLDHWNARSPAGSDLQRLRTEIERFNSHSIEPPRVVVEQGTGWTGTDLLIFYLGGADRILSYDVRPWLRVELMRRAAREILSAPEILTSWKGIDRNLLKERCERLRQSLDLTLPNLLSKMGVEYRATTDLGYTELDDESTDLFFSYSTLQRMRPADLRKIIDCSRRILKRGAISCHRVHAHDFHRITDKRVPHFFYLTINDTLWNLMTSRYLNYQNRLRIPEFASLFDGFEIEIDNSLCWDSEIEYVERHLSQKYPALSSREIATWQADIFARKK